MSVGKILIESIPSNWYIFVAVALEIAAGGIALWASHRFGDKIKSGNHKDISDDLYYTLDVSYTAFVTIISIFPLLGMFGTVYSLIAVDMSGDTAGVQENFFVALTSTAWGIIFAVLFKLINAFIQPSIENHIEKARRMLNKN